MTIPWPIRTLAADMHPLQVERVRREPVGGDRTLVEPSTDPGES